MVKRLQSYYQLIPEIFLEKLTELEVWFQKIPGYSSDNLKELISIIAVHTWKDNESWTPLKINYLRNIVPQADQYLSKLRFLQIIERSGYSIIGKSSFKYRFTSAYRSIYKKLPLTNAKLLRRIEKFQQSQKKRNSKKYTGQNEFLRHLTIEPEALEYIKTISDEDKYNYALSSITRIMNGDITYKVDKTSGRFHSNLTNLPKGLRQFVRINGIALANIDVKNCQPYLSTILLTNPKKVAGFTKYTPFSMLLENLQVEQKEDVKRYVSLVVCGQLYEYLWKEFTNRGLIFRSRDDVKKQVLFILFARNGINSPARTIFRKLFPAVHLAFSRVRGYEKNGSHFKNFKRFPILLQRIESHIILNLILNRINKEFPGTIGLTIHDSIMTNNNPIHIYRVRKIMVEEFSNFVGFEPKIKVEGGEEEENKEEEIGREGERVGKVGIPIPC